MTSCALRSPVPPDGQTLIKSIRARIDRLGGVKLELPTREAIRTVPDLDV